jgi:hypothetical protein
MLTYYEAFLFARAGHDIRWQTWPSSDFARLVEGTPHPVTGYSITHYTPTSAELSGSKWRIA